MNVTRFPPLNETLYQGTLPGGIPLLVMPKPTFSKSYAMVVVRYGSMDMRYDLGGQIVDSPAGVAHFLEHKMFDMPDYNALQRFAENGASPNAYTSHNRTAYHFSATNRFDENLALLLSLVTTPCFSEESVEKEKGIIGQEIQMIADHPGSQVFDGLFSGLFAEHPIRVPIAGTVESIADIHADTLHRCFSAFYQPARMTLAVSGPIEPESVFERAAALLATTATQITDVVSSYGKEDQTHAVRAVTDRPMEVALPLFARGFKCAPPAKGPDMARFALLSNLAMDAFCGRCTDLYASLYDEGLINDSFDQGEFHVENAALMLATGECRNPEKLRDRLLEEAARVAQNGLPEDLFNQTRRAHLGALIRRFDAPETVCHLAIDAMDNGTTPFAFYDELDHFTSEQASRLIADNVTHEKCSLSVVSPRRG